MRWIRFFCRCGKEIWDHVDLDKITGDIENLRESCICVDCDMKDLLIYRTRKALITILLCMEKDSKIKDLLWGGIFADIFPGKTRDYISTLYQQLSTNPCAYMVVDIIMYPGRMDQVVEYLLNKDSNEFRLNGAGLKLYSNVGNIYVAGDQAKNYLEFVRVANDYLKAAGLQVKP